MPRKQPRKAVQAYLWSESAGHCQNPACETDLHALSDVPIGEMAHIIAASADGPRGAGDLDDLERADADNLLLLCPTCHTTIDKSPHLYPVAILRTWKERSQLAREAAFGSPTFLSRADARARVRPLFAANRVVFERYGPTGNVRDVDRADRWTELTLTTILPNNAKLMRVFKANTYLMREDELAALGEFEIHVDQLRRRHELGDWSPLTVRFPLAILEVFNEEEA